MTTGRTYLIPVRPSWQTVYSEFRDVTHLIDSGDTVSYVVKKATDEGMPLIENFPYRLLRVGNSGVPEWMSSPVRVRKVIETRWEIKTMPDGYDD